MSTFYILCVTQNWNAVDCTFDGMLLFRLVNGDNFETISSKVTHGHYIGKKMYKSYIYISRIFPLKSGSNYIKPRPEWFLAHSVYKVAQKVSRKRLSISSQILTDFQFLVDRTNGPYGRAIGTPLHPSVVCRLSVTWYIVAKRCVLEQKLLLTAYRKSYMRNRLVPK